MSQKISQKLLLDRPTTYQVKVPGELDVSWLDWDSDMIVTVRDTETDTPVFTLVSKFDQAALQGFLRRLYFLMILSMARRRRVS